MLPDRALTLRNPWPWFMFHVPKAYRKPVENRTRNLGLHREFWLHTSKSSDRDDWTAAAQVAADAGVPLEFHPTAEGILEKLPCGHIVARVTCAGVLHPFPNAKGEAPTSSVFHGNPFGDSLTDRFRDNPWYFGKWGYVIESFTLVKPVACAGARGFWRVPADVLAKLAEAA